MLELNLSGENGVSLGLGMGGIDVSLGTIAGAMSGLRDSTKIMGAKAAGLFGDIEDVSTLNAVNMLGYSNRMSNQELAMAIWEEEIKVRYGELGNGAGGGDILGRYDARNGDEILLDNSLLGGGKEGSAKLAAVMSHENTHLKDNRYEGIAHIAGLGTYSEINAMFGLDGDSGFYGEMFAGILNPESWVENTGAVDNFIFVSGNNDDVDAFKQFIYEKTGWEISVSARGGVSIENKDNRANIGNETVAGVFADAVKDENYTINYGIVNKSKDVFFDTYGRETTACLDIGDFISANKRYEDFGTALLLHTLIEQIVLETDPNEYKTRDDAYLTAHIKAVHEEGLFLFGENLIDRKDDFTPTNSEIKTGYYIKFKTRQTGTERILLFNVDDRRTPY